MKITAISAQIKNQNRVNVSVDGSYKFSLDLYQLVDLGIRIGNEYTEKQLTELLLESEFGKLYARALEYCLMRPHSEKEVRNYLWRKTCPVRLKDGAMKPGYSQQSADRVFQRLKEKNYLNDDSFTLYWVENRSQTKGVSKRKLQAELQSKGVESSIIEARLAESIRDDKSELMKVISKKSRRYHDPQKFTAYLLRQGFSYDDIKSALSGDE